MVKLKRRVSGMSLVEDIIAMAILVGILVFMYAGFSIVTSYIFKGLSIKEASSYSMESIEKCVNEINTDGDTSAVSGITKSTGTVIITDGAVEKTVSGTYYTAQKKAEDITTDKTVYYTVFDRKDV